ncbi:PIN domain-containing protein [Thiothrix eikelboomii]|uniref:PIN domain-containing protein n=2 Tax=Thiothrix eikelboomii TaxID=92487 RepID=A0A1T4W2V9_9GAMM|nr:PIN domain-containing protein [Thiothrix eikelboomii]
MTMRKVLLDANLLIAALDNGSTTSEAERTKAKQTLAALLSNAEVALIITPLIRYEVLRGIGWQDQERFFKVKQSLDGFTELDVNRQVSELAANLFRFDRATHTDQQRNIEKRKFDVFHLASAKCHDLELASQDSDIAGLESLYERFYRLGMKTAL